MIALAKKESIKTAEEKARQTQRQAAAEAEGALTVSSEKGNKNTRSTRGRKRILEGRGRIHGNQKEGLFGKGTQVAA